MKKLVTLLVSVLLTTVSLSAQVTKTVHVETAGKLNSLLTKSEMETVEKLIITGDLNTFDFMPLKNMATNNALSVIDLSGCDSLKHIYAFGLKGAKKLSEIILPSNLEDLEASAFAETDFSSIDLSHCSSLKVIGSLAFINNESLSKVTFPQSLETIMSQVFLGCKSLTSIAFPDSLISIGSAAFRGTELTEVDLSRCVNLTTIGETAFSSCNNITSIVLPDSLKSVGRQAFNFTYPEGVAGTLISRAITPPTAITTSFSESVYKNTTLYVPAGSLEAYKSADAWQNFYKIEEMAPTSINPEDADKTVSVVGGQGELVITAENPQQVDVYTLQGVRVLSQTVDGGTFTIPLSEGVYIVRIGNASYKVHVK